MSKSILIKGIFLGESKAGKTKLLEALNGNLYKEQYKATIGADFLLKKLTNNNQNITFQMWDTAGQERYHSLGTAFYRGSDVELLCVDMSNDGEVVKKHLDAWHTEFIQTAGDDISTSLIVVGTKGDLESTHGAQDAAQAWADEHGAPFVITSSKTGEGLEELCHSIVNSKAVMKQQYEQEKSMPNEITSLDLTSNSSKTIQIGVTLVISAAVISFLMWRWKRNTDK
eukprot:CAMPEP_0201545762 /NCGR_PEP_ID=MMETSP0173_2-20130828/2196_1 /ASSEMBLY_ACC=CAM_ASM_000268 /TAXON_ID=218659 /ORGANISM="Vexillifera sp., Strain DIVA3 564/2" /LENGTH=226 /DNA_ID=CAMNT_0047954253 /DNA_START=58 /DNA_END=738 /DNA_ORIENTATION=+